jgi:hypothetical protein
MKRFLIIVIALFISSQLFAQTGNGEKLSIKENTYTNLRFTSAIAKEDLQIMKVNTKKGLFTQITVPEYGRSLQTGDPGLPVLKKIIEVPVGANFRIVIHKAVYSEFPLSDIGSTYKIMPAQPSVSKSDDPKAIPLIYNENTYKTNEYFGFDAVSVENIGFMRGVRVARLNIAPVQYNPVTGMIKLLTSLDAEVVFDNADINATIALKKDKFSPMFEGSYQAVMNYKEPQQKDLLTKYPVKYVIVSDPMFQTALQPFVQWKTKKGFKVIEAYTNNVAVGNTTTSIKNYLQGLYNAGTAGDPAPTYVLFVGDVAQIPAFTSGGQATDLYYCEYTGDYIPEMIYGRFSATNVSQLQPQIDKTLEYEQYLMPDVSFLGEVIMIAGVDASNAPTYGNGQINYGTDTYFNASNNLTSHTYLYPASNGSVEASIITDINRGCTFANYTAHGGSDGWSDPTINTSDVANLTNAHKYPLMVGNCCLTNKYDDTECFGEALLRANLKGALGYIGGSNVSYWNEDYYFGVGYRSSIQVNPVYSASAMGAYDRVFHTHGEPFSQWTMSQGQYMMGGNLAVTQGGSMVQYYWEIYGLMGDPSLMVYYGVPTAITATYNALIPLGSTTFNIQTVPWGYAAVSMNGTLLGAALADSLGNVTVPLTGVTTPGTADVVITRQNKAPYIGTVVIANPSGPYVLYSSNTVHDAAGNNNGLVDCSEPVNLDITLHNFGSATATGVSATLSCPSSFITLTDNSQSWGNVTASSDAAQNAAYAFNVANNIPDQESLQFTMNIQDNASNSWTSHFNLIANAPDLQIGVMSIDDASGNGNGYLDTAEVVNIIINTLNDGHADALNTVGTLTTTTPQYVTINSGTHNFGTLSDGTNANASFNLTVSPTAPDSAVVELTYQVTSGGYSAIYQYFLPLGVVDEDWESGDFTQFDWQSSGDVPWIITSTNPYEGTYCAQSGDVDDDQSSVLSITMNVMINDTISFWKKVSSESSYDFLNFKIDGAATDQWSGEVAWSKNAYAVTAGSHTFTWDYSKDYSMSSGSDCAWLDYILFPPIVTSVIGMNENTASIDNLNLKPNPVAGMTQLTFTITEPSDLVLSIRDVTGRTINTPVVMNNKAAGTYTMMINASSYDAGLYYVVLESASQTRSVKMLVTK